MYRIELKPGEENVFRTIEELATGIRNGLVTSRARIFHNASQKWLPIEFHPHYKKALRMPRAKSGETPAVVVASMPAPAAAPVHAPAPVHVHAPARAHAPPPVSAPASLPRAIVSPVVDLPTISYDYPEATKDPLPVAQVPLGRAPARRRLSPFHFGIVAAVLAAGTYVAVSAATPARKPDSAAPEPRTDQPVAEQAAPAAAAPSTDSSTLKPVVTAAVSASGPTFGPPALPPAVAKRSIVTTAGSSPPAPAPKDSAATIEPAPDQVDLSLPSLPSGDSLAPAAPTDSNAIRRILRAVSGKEAPAPRP